MRSRMPSLLLAGAVLVLVAGAGVGSGSSGGVPTSARVGASSAYVPGELIVRLEAATASELIGGAVGPGRALLRRPRLPHDAGQASGRTSVEQAAEELEADPDVLYAEPNYLRTLSVLPNDPMFDSSTRCASRPIGTSTRLRPGTRRRAARTSSSPSSTAVWRTGTWTERQHSSTTTRPAPATTTATASSTTRSGGTSTRTTTHRSTSTGTELHVGGTIGAEGNNGAGVTGVNWNVSLYAGAGRRSGRKLE